METTPGPLPDQPPKVPDVPTTGGGLWEEPQTWKEAVNLGAWALAVFVAMQIGCAVTKNKWGVAIGLGLVLVALGVWQVLRVLHG